jgi:hypothetical protein
MQKRELQKLVVQVVVAVREGDQIVDEEAGIYAPGPEGPVWVPNQQQAIYNADAAHEFFANQVALCKASQPNRAARRGK